MYRLKEKVLTIKDAKDGENNMCYWWVTTKFLSQHQKQRFWRNYHKETHMTNEGGGRMATDTRYEQMGRCSAEHRHRGQQTRRLNSDINSEFLSNKTVEITYNNWEKSIKLSAQAVWKLTFKPSPSEQEAQGLQYMTMVSRSCGYISSRITMMVI